MTVLAHEAPPAAATALIHKQVAFQFDGHSLQLGLSQSLFSSYEVDAGSRLLLKSIAQQLATLPEERRRLRAVLDLGCGTGVLGLALARRYGAALTARDRDALALAVTAHNAALNGVACTTRGGIDVSNLDGSRDPGGYDLVVANLPAKAGAPVLARLLAAAAAVTAPGGRIAVVVVTPLAAQTRSQLAAVAEPIHEARGSRHTVLHARPRPRAGAAPDGAAGGGGKTSGGAEPLAAYVRHRGEFTLTDRAYHLDTVYGVPDFDTPSHLTRFTAGLIQRAGQQRRLRQRPAGPREPLSILVWNPGQGHLPVWLAGGALAEAYGGTGTGAGTGTGTGAGTGAGAAAGGGARFTLVSRDALQLLATAANLHRTGIPAAALTVRHQVTLNQPVRHHLAVLLPDADLGGADRRRLLPELAPLLLPAASAVITGPARLVAPLLTHRKPLTLVRESKRRALRGAILQAPAAEGDEAR